MHKERIKSSNSEYQKVSLSLQNNRNAM